MTNFNATQYSLLVSGGSGSNYIPDGYIRTVEKIWLDSFAFTAVLTTADTVAIGTIPANKKIVGVEVMFPQASTPTSTMVINVGPSYATTALISGATIPTTLTPNVYKFTQNQNMGYVITSGTSAVSGGTITTFVNTPIYLSISGTALVAPTAGTIYTILRYT